MSMDKINNNEIFRETLQYASKSQPSSSLPVTSWHTDSTFAKETSIHLEKHCSATNIHQQSKFS